MARHITHMRKTRKGHKILSGIFEDLDVNITIAVIVKYVLRNFDMA
jgi:hypothetical protein